MAASLNAELSFDAQLADARSQIDRMLRSSAAEADAIRERLARLGDALQPEVYGRLRQTTDDRQRELLLALRYRLAAGDALALRWPGGVVRLASADLRRRQQAAEELAKMAAPEDQPLLLELFSDPDPMVRETSLRGLQQIGGKGEVAIVTGSLTADNQNQWMKWMRKRVEEKYPEMKIVTVKPSPFVHHAPRSVAEAVAVEAYNSKLNDLTRRQWLFGAVLGPLGLGSLTGSVPALFWVTVTDAANVAGIAEFLEARLECRAAGITLPESTADLDGLDRISQCRQLAGILEQVASAAGRTP